jgi:hypothetical protein
MNKLWLGLLISVLSVTAKADSIKTSPLGITFFIARPSWVVDPGLYTIRKANQNIERNYWFGASPTQSITPAYLTGDAAFYLTDDNCGTTVDASCDLKVGFNSSGKATGRYTAVLTVGDLDVPVTAVVGYDKPKYQILDSMGVEISQINMNTVFQGLHGSISRSLTIKDLNKSSTSTLIPSVSSPFATSSTCTASSLNSNLGCTVTVTLSGSTSPGSYSGTLTLDTSSVGVVADVQPIANRGSSSSFILISNAGRVLSSVSFPDSSVTISGIVRLKDINARASSTSTQSLSTTPDFSFGSSTTCAITSLNNEDGCGVRIYANNSSGLGTHTATFYTSINSGAYPVSHTLVSAPIVEPKFVFADDTAKEGRVIKPEPISASVSSATKKVYLRDLNESTPTSGISVTVSQSTDSAASPRIISVVPSSCPSQINSDIGCTLNIGFSNPSNAVGTASSIITIKIGNREEVLVFEQEAN